MNNEKHLKITLFVFLLTVLTARVISFLVIKTDELPRSLFLTIHGFRLHHFVYGNIILLVLGFVEFVLNVKMRKRVAAFFYGLALGLVIDEFALWSGAISFLGAGSLQVFNGINLAAVLVVTFILLGLIYRENRV